MIVMKMRIMIRKVVKIAMIKMKRIVVIQTKMMILLLESRKFKLNLDQSIIII